MPVLAPSLLQLLLPCALLPASGRDGRRDRGDSAGLQAFLQQTPSDAVGLLGRCTHWRVWDLDSVYYAWLDQNPLETQGALNVPCYVVKLLVFPPPLS